MKTLCDIFALRYLRIPPIVRVELDPALDRALGPGQWSLEAAAALLGLHGRPVDVLQTERGKSVRTSRQHSHLVTGELPFGSMREIGSYAAVTSPALTFLMLARRLELVDLIMLMHEACGTFSVYAPTDEERAYLQDLVGRRALERLGGWEPVLDRNGMLTNLWKRPPLVTLGELRAFAEQTRGVTGHKRFVEALRHVHEGAASPFEVQTGLRIGLPRRLGGEGLGPLEYNRPVRLSDGARRISGQRKAYIDVLVTNAAGTREVGIECQSALVHDVTERGIADGNRITALQSMGFVMVQLSYENLVNPAKFASIVAYLRRELGVPARPKTERQMRSEIDLRRHLFADWTLLGL